jgi:hypothetical protein
MYVMIEGRGFLPYAIGFSCDGMACRDCLCDRDSDCTP